VKRRKVPDGPHDIDRHYEDVISLLLRIVNLTTDRDPPDPLFVLKDIGNQARDALSYPRLED
jgi:hypothetical protein